MSDVKPNDIKVEEPTPEQITKAKFLKLRAKAMEFITEQIGTLDDDMAKMLHIVMLGRCDSKRLLLELFSRYPVALFAAFEQEVVDKQVVGLSTVCETKGSLIEVPMLIRVTERDLVDQCFPRAQEADESKIIHP